MRGAVEKLVLACFLGILTVALYGCGGGSSKTVPVTPPPPIALGLPTGHGLTPTGENPIQVPAGETVRSGNIDITCPAGGAACVVAVTGEGATYEATGGTPSVAAARELLDVTGVGSNHGLTGTEPETIEAGATKRVGNVDITCPGATGDPACVVVGATYEATGAMPTVAVAHDPLDVTGNHGLTGTEPTTIAAGATERHGNVDITCPAGGEACVVVGATYAKTGGMPTVAVAHDPLDVTGVGRNHDLGTEQETTIEAGTTERVGNVDITCPGATGDPACVVVGPTYKATGGMPTVAAVHNPLGVTGNHDLTGTEPITIAAGATERHGNVNITCPAGGEACVVLGATYDATGGMPTVAGARDPLDVTGNHDLTGTEPITIAAGATERHGNVDITCPAGGEACVVVGATYDATGGMPTVAVAHDPLDVTGVGRNHDLTGTEPITIAAGETERVGNVDITCPAGGEACVVVGATYDATGGMPTVAVVHDPLDVTGVGPNHGLTDTEQKTTIAAGATKRVGNVDITCPGATGDPACVVLGATYDAAGGMPTVAAVHNPLGVTGNHDLTGTEPITIAAGETERVGNVDITCPAGGEACVVVGATYDATGGMPTVAGAHDPLDVTGVGPNHGLTDTEQETTIAAGATKRVGNVDITCPGATGDPACVVLGATYDAAGGMPTVAAVHNPLGVTGNHDLTGTEPITIAAGATERHGNVNITCPAGGEACVVLGATYDATGGMPTVAGARDPLDVTGNHDLTGTEPITIAAGATERHGNVDITCPAGGEACVVLGATYDATGGMPTVAGAHDPLDVTGVGPNHGLTDTEQETTIAAGATKRVGNVDITCPAGGEACVVVGATYDATGGTPTVVATAERDPLVLTEVGSNHGLTGTEPITIAAGATERHGNVDITCPAGGEACVVEVTADGPTYNPVGGTPTVAVAKDPLDTPLPTGHGYAVDTTITIEAGKAKHDTRGVNITCPAGGEDCVVEVTANGATYEATGGTPAVQTNAMILAASSGPSGNSNGGHSTGVNQAMRFAVQRNPVRGNAAATNAISQSSVVGNVVNPTSVSLDILAPTPVATDPVSVRLTGNGFDSLTTGTPIVLGANSADSAPSNLREPAKPPFPLKDWGRSAFVSGSIHAVTHSDVRPVRNLRISNHRVFNAFWQQRGYTPGTSATPSTSATPATLSFYGYVPPSGEPFTGAITSRTLTLLPRTDRNGVDTGGMVRIGQTSATSGLGPNNNDYPLRLLEARNLESTPSGYSIPVEVQVFGTWVPGRLTCGTTGGVSTSCDATQRVITPGDAATNSGRSTFPATSKWILTLNDVLVPVPDWDFMTLGIWASLPQAPDGAFNIGAFAQGSEPFIRTTSTGFQPNSLDRVGGNATYRGVATGIYSRETNLGSFDATASLSAAFGNGLDSDATMNVQGSISDFREYGKSLGDWRVNLLQATPGGNNDLTSTTFVGQTSLTSALVGAIPNNVVSNAGRWGAEFFGVETLDAQISNTGSRRQIPDPANPTGPQVQSPPTSVAGTFGAGWQSADGNRHLTILGAFGAERPAD